jgi:hypothetical protein
MEDVVFQKFMITRRDIPEPKRTRQIKFLGIRQEGRIRRSKYTSRDVMSHDTDKEQKLHKTKRNPREQFKIKHGKTTEKQVI